MSYWINDGVHQSKVEEGLVSPFAYENAPKSHKGKKLWRHDNNGDISGVAAYGETIWPKTYHYTTAQMEKSDGTVLTTSGRQWDIGYSEATSPYYAPKLSQNEEARTYWGK